MSILPGDSAKKADKYSAPIPVLGQEYGSGPRKWTDAPKPVRVAGTMALLAVSFYAAIFGLLIFAVPTNGDLTRLSPFLIFVPIVVLNILLICWHLTGNPLGWKTTSWLRHLMPMAPIMLVMEPLVFAKWDTPEVRAWYGIEAPR